MAPAALSLSLSLSASRSRSLPLAHAHACRTVGFACCYAWTLVGHMAAPNLLVLADLIAPFIPLGLCGSLSVVAGGLSLLFPSCWRKPLPNTVAEAENKALVPIKDRYPSFRDLTRSGKLASLTAPSPTPSNVYSVPPTHPKDQGIACGRRSPVAQSYTLHHCPHHLQHQDDQLSRMSPADHLFEGHYEVADPEVRIDEFHASNWQLYADSGILDQPTLQHNQSQLKRSTREAHMFKAASRGYSWHPADTSQLAGVDHVAETNL